MFTWYRPPQSSPDLFSLKKFLLWYWYFSLQSAWWILNTYGYLYQIWKDRWIIVTLNFFVVFRAPFVYQLHANTPISWRSLLDSHCTNLQVVNWRTNYFSFRRSLQKNTRTFYFVSIAFFSSKRFPARVRKETEKFKVGNEWTSFFALHDVYWN